MFYIFQTYGSEILYILGSVDLIFLPLVLAVSIFQYFLSAWRWCFIASKTQSSINYSDAIRYYYIAGFMNNILPTGILGDVYRTLNIKVNNKNSSNFVKSLQSVIFERLSGQLALVVTFIFSLQLFFIVNQKYMASAYVLAVIILLFSSDKAFVFLSKEKPVFYQL